MKKRFYATPAVEAVELQQQDMLCGSGPEPSREMDIHDEYSDAVQLSNKSIWDGLW